MKITAQAIGDPVTAISELHKVAQSYGKDIFLDFAEGFSIAISPTSQVQDLITIYKLEQKVKALERKINDNDKV